MQLLSACWSAGVKAEIVPRACPSLAEQYEFAHTRGIRWLVLLEEDKLLSSNVVKVSSGGSQWGEITSRCHITTRRKPTLVG